MLHDATLMCGICHPESSTATTHVHTAGVSTVTLSIPGTMHVQKVHQWLASILESSVDTNATATNKSEPATSNHNDQQQIFRFKGIISVRFESFQVPSHCTKGGDELGLYLDRHLIVQGVYDLWDIRACAPNCFGIPTQMLLPRPTSIGARRSTLLATTTTTAVDRLLNPNSFNKHLAPRKQLRFCSGKGSGATSGNCIHSKDRPVWVLYGDKDPRTPGRRVESLIKYESVVKVVELAGVGHCPHDEAPELVNPLLAVCYLLFCRALMQTG
jgi:hypothetical protein